MLYQSVAYAAFSLEKKQIVAERCVQRDAEVNSCQGSCYLREVLNIQDENESSEPAFILDYEPIPFHPTTSIELPRPLEDQTSYSLLSADAYQSVLLLGIWRPPRLRAWTPVSFLNNPKAISNEII